jgi:lipoate-protein ligase A
MFSLLKVGQEKISDKMIAAVEDRVSCLKYLKPELTLNQAYEALLKGFTLDKKFNFGAWTEAELDRAKELVEKRYRTSSWTALR